MYVGLIESMEVYTNVDFASFIALFYDQTDPIGLLD